MGHLVMSDKERQYQAWMVMVKEGKVTLAKASEALGVSYRQIKRIYKRYRLYGDKGLVHKGRHRSSNRRHKQRDVIVHLYRTKYLGFGPTLAAEKLEDDGHFINHETLRRWLVAEGLWQRERKRSPYRKQRERRAQFGELVQMDGSIHDWFSNGKKYCLVNMVDDATGMTLSRLETSETVSAVMRTLWQWVEKYGIPMAIYVDLKNVYVSRKENGMCHLERACEKLGIRIIKAYSPQAKGRVERNHGVYQDRFVKELQLKGAKTIAQANKILGDYFIDDLNKKFARSPLNPESAHREIGKIDLNQIFCQEYERQVQHDFTFSFNGKCYQIKKVYGSLVKPKANVIIRHHLDGEMSVWYKDERLNIKGLRQKPKLTVIKRSHLTQSQIATMNKHKTPWSRDMHHLYDTDNNPKRYEGLYFKKGHFYRAK